MSGGSDPGDGEGETLFGETLPRGTDTPRPDSIGRYSLGGVLGRGGMGEVVSARDAQIGRFVAIKRLRAVDPSPGLVDRFLREARIQGRLEHPAIVPVHELSVDEAGRPFFAMKQLAGVTLGDVIAKLAIGDVHAAMRFSRPALLRAFAEVCLAIEFAHVRGIVHRDLKPQNIMLGEFGEVYVLDWGIAQVLGSSIDERASFADIPIGRDTDATGTLAGQVLGTPGYMSPEQLRGDASLDGRSDVYALGCILFELLAREPLHPRSAAVPSTLAGGDARPSRRAPDRDIAPELDAICTRAVQLDRADRYATARELGAAVQQFLDGDRDVALRKQLAAAELDAARAAVARGNHADARAAAMRAAGRALALDPTSGAADLVARLMLAPPDELPAEVETEIRALDDDALFASRRQTTAVMCAYLSFWPILWLAGLHPPWFMLGGAAVCIATAVAVWSVPRRSVHRIAWISLAGNLAMLVLFSQLVGPFTASPGLAVIFAMTMATHVRVIRAPALAAAICVAVLLPWLLGAVGAMAPMTAIEGDALVFHTSADQLVHGVAMAGLIAYVLLLVGMAVWLTRIATAHRRSAQRSVQIQSWQLRQLVTS
jgi:serine/threonine-protein kinase